MGSQGDFLVCSGITEMLNPSWRLTPGGSTQAIKALCNSVCNSPVPVWLHYILSIGLTTSQIVLTLEREQNLYISL